MAGKQGGEGEHKTVEIVKIDLEQYLEVHPQTAAAVHSAEALQHELQIRLPINRDKEALTKGLQH